MQQGKIFFEKILKASSLPPHYQLTLPAQFVQQHGDKIHKSVTLRNEANRKMWIVKINIIFPHKRLQTVFSRGWKDFAVANDLDIGDQLTFVLVAKSLFDVFILRNGGNSVLSVRILKMRSLDPLLSRSETKKSLEPQHGCEISAKGCEKSEIALSGLFAKENAEETVADFASEAPDFSQSPGSDMDSHFFEPMIQEEEQECVSKSLNDTACHDQGQSTLPHFLKQITMSNRGSNTLEIPCSFLKMHYTRLGTRVKLQGIHEESPVLTVACCLCNDKGRPRVFFRSGWSSFVNENFLRIGQRLIFTLTADSFFVVRNYTKP